MTQRGGSILLLTPRGGVDNHRFITGMRGFADSGMCGRVYREVKSAIEVGKRGVGRLGDGNWFAAASHVVTQEESAGRRGAEWLIFSDPRIGALSERDRNRLLVRIDQHLALVRDQVLGRVTWDDHVGTDTIKDETLEGWADHFADVLEGVSPIPDGESPTEEPTGIWDWCQSHWPFVVPAMIAAALAFVVLSQVGLFRWPEWPRPGKPPVAQRSSPELLKEVSRCFDSPVSAASEDDVLKELEKLFGSPRTEKERKKSVEEMLQMIRQQTSGHKTSAIVEDKEFMALLRKAIESQDKRAFLSEADREVVRNLKDPALVRSLAAIARQFREMDRDAAKPDDKYLVSLFNGLCKCSDAVARSTDDSDVGVFTQSDVQYAHELLRVFRDVKEEVERNTIPVSDQDDVAGWIEALGQAQGGDLYSEKYFEVQLAVNAKNSTPLKRECLILLKKFCGECRRFRKPPAARGPEMLR